MSEPVVFWDFDGTLAQRPGLWSACVLEVLDESDPGHGITVDRLRDGLRHGFPWHQPERPHPELNDPDAWWRTVGSVIAAALTGSGYASSSARELVPLVRGRFIDGSVGWRLFPDTVAALVRTRSAGWRNVVLSNHVPELEDIARTLGLDSYLDGVISSALTGFEKPHPGAYRTAVRACGRPRRVWMVGDNPIADVAGAEAVGIPAILVRTDSEAKRRAVDLEQAAMIVTSETGQA